MLNPLLFSFLASLPFFIPPTDWEWTKPKTVSSYVQVGFIGKGASDFRPSLNFSTEEIDVSLKEYVKAVKKIHNEEPNTSWRDLGKFKIQAGEARLTEITTTSAWGTVQMLQLLFVEGNRAYILTGAALKQDFSKVQSHFLETFRSFCFIPDLLTPLPETKKGEFETLLSSDSENKQEQWKNLQKAAANCSELGGLWHFLVLKEGYFKIFQKEI